MTSPTYNLRLGRDVYGKIHRIPFEVGEAMLDVSKIEPDGGNYTGFIFYDPRIKGIFLLNPLEAQYMVYLATKKDFIKFTHPHLPNDFLKEMQEHIRMNLYQTKIKKTKKGYDLTLPIGFLNSIGLQHSGFMYYSKDQGLNILTPEEFNLANMGSLRRGDKIVSKLESVISEALLKEIS